MLLKDFIPGPSLRSFVKCYRIIHFAFDDSQAIPSKAYPPKPEQTLHFFLKKPFTMETAVGKISAPPILFTPQQTSLVQYFTSSDFWDVQIVFQPTAVFLLTGIPANKLINQFFDATNIFSKNLQCTFAQLQEAPTYAKLINIVENFAKDLIRNARKEFLLIDAACEQMNYRHGKISVEWLAKESCYCTKQFKRKFIERVGLPPKTYARILRLNRSYNIRNSFPDKGWAFIAAECGYFDYQHLSKDYREFTGLTPSALHFLEKDSPENLLGLAKSLYRTRYITSS